MADTQTDLSLSDLRAALNAPPVPADERVEPVAETPEPVVEPTETEKPAEVAETPTEQPKKAERRFSKLTERAQTAEARAAELQRELESLRSQKPTEPAKPAASDEGKPVAPNAATWEGTWEELESARAEYQEKLTDWKVEQKLKAKEAEAAATAAKERAETTHRNWNEQVSVAMEEHEEMESAINQTGPQLVKKGLAEVIMESEVGAKILLQVHNDEALRTKLLGMSAASAAREIGKIEDRILAKKNPAATVKTLPRPVAVVGGTAAGEHGAIDYSKASISTLRQQLGKSRR